MGTHPSNPSKDLKTGRTLLDMVDDNQALLSGPVAVKYHKKLPFLFKVLSIGKALSIQAHPNKKLAEELHARDPKNYPDDNHKPEMAIAITPFEGLCSFRPLGEIVFFLKNVPALVELVSPEEAKAFTDSVKPDAVESDEAATATNKNALQRLFTACMSCSTSRLESSTHKLVEAAKSEGKDFAGGGCASTSGSVLSELVTRLYAQFGADIGLFNLFFLNFVKLEPGEALFLQADDIHAYVSGDIVECMAASDNVVRAGFTPKFKDVKTLTSMLTYSYAPIEEQKMNAADYPYATLNRQAYSGGSDATLYDPPIEEFSVVRTLLRGGEGAKATFDPIDGPSIVICTAGKGKISVGPTSEEVKAGYVFFIGATAQLVLEAEGDKEDDFITFRAFCEVEDHSNGA
jgi:mannose-6-phosphate isomerase